MRSETGRARATASSRSRKSRSATLPEPSISCLICWSTLAKSGLAAGVTSSPPKTSASKNAVAAVQNGAVGRLRLQRLDRGHRALHLAQRLGDVAALEHAAAGPAGTACAAVAAPWRAPRRRARASAAMGGSCAARFGKKRSPSFASVAPRARFSSRYGPQQAHRVVGLPGEQRVEVATRARRSPSWPRPRRAGRRAGVLALEEGDELLELLVEARGRAQPHHRERTRGLVQVREDVLDRRALGRGRGELVERSRAPASSEWSISVLTQVSGPRSKSETGLAAMVVVFACGSP